MTPLPPSACTQCGQIGGEHLAHCLIAKCDALNARNAELVMRLEMMLVQADAAELACSNLAELATPAAKREAKNISMGLRVECAEARALLAKDLLGHVSSATYDTSRIRPR